MSTRFSLLLLFVFLFNNSYTQNIITDTVSVNFNCDSIIPMNYYWKAVKDNRNVNPKLVSYSQNKKYIFIPVDVEICTKKPLSSILANNSSITHPIDTFSLQLDYFTIEKYNGRFIKTYGLYANMPLKQIKNGNEVNVGTIIYNFEYQPRGRKITNAAACEEVLSNWHRQFKIDMLSVSEYLKTNEEKPAVLLDENIKKSHFFNILVGGVAGLNFWQVDGEIYFTRPETNLTRWFTGSFVRYQNTSDFEMFGFGKKCEHFTSRLSEKAVFDITSNLMIGLNKWKETEDIKLWQILQLSFSSTQTINFDRINLPGLVFRAGLFENIFYIPVEKVGFQVGPYLSAGYKF